MNRDSSAMAHHRAAAAGEAAESRLRPNGGLLKKGQALIWSANILHGGASQRDRSRTRHSQVTHFFFEGCPVLHTPDVEGRRSGRHRLARPRLDSLAGRRATAPSGIPAIAYKPFDLASRTPGRLPSHLRGAPKWELGISSAAFAMESTPSPTQWHSMRDLCRELQDAVFVKDLDGRYMMVNEAMASLLGGEPDGVVGRTDEEMLPDHSEALRANDRAVIDTGRSLTVEEPMILDGELRTFLTSKAPLKDATGALIGVIGIATDITSRKASEEELRLSQARLAEAQAVARVGSWDWDLVRDDCVWSTQLCEIYGVDPETFDPNSDAFRALVHPDDLGELDEAVARATADGEHFEVEHRIVRPDGEERSVLCRGQVFLDVDGTAMRMIGACVDITAWRRMQERLSVRENQLAVAQEMTGVGSFEWDPATGKLTWSRQLYRTFGVSPDQFTPSLEGYLELVHPEDRHNRQVAVEDALRDGTSAGQHRIVRPDGQLRWLDSRLRVINDDGDGSPRVIGACRDITNERNAEADLRREIASAQARALVDPLTGVGNRRLAHERLTHALALAERSGSQVGVLYIDLDGFKQINDDLDHAAGDEVLLEVARRLGCRLRRSDTLARIGGDEFLVICEGDEVGGSATAERLTNAFGAPFAIRGAQRTVGVTIGHAVAPEDGTDADTLIAEADRQMYARRLQKTG